MRRTTSPASSRTQTASREGGKAPVKKSKIPELQAGIDAAGGVLQRGGPDGAMSVIAKLAKLAKLNNNASLAYPLRHWA
jgi:hypothetical protein